MTKILVIRFSSIGDIVLTSPVLRCIKQQIEGVELHMLTKKQYASMFSAHPYVDHLHLLGSDQKALIQQLKVENFDYIIDLHHNLRTARIKWALKVAAYSFPKLNIKKWLTVRLKRNVLPEQHVVERYFTTVAPLGVKNDFIGIDFFIPSEDQVDINQVYGTTRVIAFAIGAQFATKRLPREKIVEIIQQLEEFVVLLGGEEDKETGDWIVSQLKRNNVVNSCGKLRLNQSASVVQQASVLLTHDTGLMHIASAFNTPIVSVWGNTVPAFGMFPYRPKKPNSFVLHEISNLSCRPCSKIGFNHCPKKHFKCMNDQNTTYIADSAKKLAMTQVK